MLPEDGRRPKHVGAFKYFNVCFLNTESISAFVGFFFDNCAFVGSLYKIKKIQEDIFLDSTSSAVFFGMDFHKEENFKKTFVEMFTEITL
jgi:hypothetical protein